MSPDLSYINPRELLKSPNGMRQLYEILQEKTRYTPQDLPFRALCKSILRQRALLCEGIRGGGKTALGEALSDSCNLRLYFLACVPGLKIEDTLYQWDKTAQSLFQHQQDRLGRPLEEIQKEQWKKQFCKLGTVLEAFEFSAVNKQPCVLIVDEIDKIEPREQTFLYQILERGYADIPNLYPTSRVGFFPRTNNELHYPIILLTSNGGEIAEPLRSRARYADIKLPTKQERVKILYTKVPNSPENVLRQVCRLINGIESLPLRERPALREYLDFYESITAEGVTEITQEILLNEVSCLAKCKHDLIEFVGDGEAEGNLDLLVNEYVLQPDENIDEYIQKARHDAISRNNRAKATFNT